MADRRVGRPSPRRAPQEELERMLGLYRDKYADFTVKHFHEQLVKRHGYVLGYTVTKPALHAAGLVRPAPKRSAHRKKRPRRPMRGMLLHQDGSRHAWLEGQPALDLIVTLDDATSEILGEHNRQFAIAPEEDGTAFVPDREGAWRDILCVIEERVVGNDNTVAWNGRRLQLPESRLRPHFVRAKVQVREHPDGTLAVDLGPHRLARYGADGNAVPAAPRVASCSKASRDGLSRAERGAGASQRPPLTPSARAAEKLPCRKGSKGTLKGRALKHQAQRKRAA